MLERKKYGPLGWNKFDAFTLGDFNISRDQMRQFIQENDKVPFKAI